MDYEKLLQLLMIKQSEIHRLLFFWLIVSIFACENNQSTMDKKNEEAYFAKNMEQLLKMNEEIVTIEGIYTMHNPYRKKKGVKKQDLPAQIVFEGDEDNGVFLEPFWHEDAKRNLNEIEKFEGKKVLVTGTFYESMPENPDPRMASLGGLCIHPVQKIELVENSKK